MSSLFLTTSQPVFSPRYKETYNEALSLETLTNHHIKQTRKSQRGLRSPQNFNKFLSKLKESREISQKVIKQGVEKMSKANNQVIPKSQVDDNPWKTFLNANHTQKQALLTKQHIDRVMKNLYKDKATNRVKYLVNDDNLKGKNTPQHAEPYFQPLQRAFTMRVAQEKIQKINLPLEMEDFLQASARFKIPNSPKSVKHSNTSRLLAPSMKSNSSKNLNSPRNLYHMKTEGAITQQNPNSPRSTQDWISPFKKDRYYYFRTLKQKEQRSVNRFLHNGDTQEYQPDFGDSINEEPANNNTDAQQVAMSFLVKRLENPKLFQNMAGIAQSNSSSVTQLLKKSKVLKNAGKHIRDEAKLAEQKKEVTVSETFRQIMNLKHLNKDSARSLALRTDPLITECADYTAMNENLTKKMETTFKLYDQSLEIIQRGLLSENNEIDRMIEIELYEDFMEYQNTPRPIYSQASKRVVSHR